MATADQLKSLIKAHMAGDDQKFRTTVLQIAAYEARQSHAKLARELKKMVDTAPIPRRSNVVSINQTNPMLQLSTPDTKLDELVVSDSIKEKINRILEEYQNRHKLASYGLQNRRKILIEGPPGTGKTFTASVIASRLHLPLYTVQTDKIMTKYMGETSVKLRQLFDTIRENPGVYLFDEFDALGSDRSLDNEIGEMRRVLNSFLQFIEEDNSESIIIAATNNSQLLDQALFRRFDDVLHYTLPSEDEIYKLFVQRLAVFQRGFKPTKTLIRHVKTLSQAELVRICDDAIKDSILNDQPVTENKLIMLIKDRLSIYSNREA
jgi:SpoVK/Ycf46/Vps4 family AAA+-type ATPase